MNMMARDMIPAWVDGKLTAVEKMDVHKRGLRHKAVSVFVMRNDKVLIQRRALTKYHTPGLWANTCCTHPLWGEAPEDCAIRRLNEELGITGLYPSFRDQVEYRADVGNGMTEHELVDIFLATAPADLSVTPNPDEVMDTRWISFFDLAAEVARKPERYSAWLRIYLQEHRDRIFGSLVQA
ncbi:isopentenyl-diphosphate Delta-isomerase [Litoreibacter roseus]|uniref:Isopentenyl-diphosphate Delta-isomerase n=1 Tax=Litoreibacter roseus TaxID=2601869 RepID=A0A6N6JES2_9RHOB|nr:isopentenyl-diphosphate Delta-isomerase [Litoreibacter roseus]GFE64624.1 isopentenyl-diphosphate Delta-isomerase [Litoreibacter roseus]